MTHLPEVAHMSDSGRKVDIVAAAIEEAISTGRWPVGSKLPPETALVEELGVARNTCAKRYGLLHTPEFCPFVTVAACTSWRRRRSKDYSGAGSPEVTFSTY